METRKLARVIALCAVLGLLMLANTASTAPPTPPPTPEQIAALEARVAALEADDAALECVTVETDPLQLTSAGSVFGLRAFCPDDFQVTGGGFTVVPVQSGIRILDLGPDFDDFFQVWRWRCSAVNEGGGDLDITCIARCCR